MGKQFNYRAIAAMAENRVIGNQNISLAFARRL